MKRKSASGGEIDDPQKISETASCDANVMPAFRQNENTRHVTDGAIIHKDLRPFRP